jgi:hypothetical protein
MNFLSYASNGVNFWRCRKHIISAFILFEVSLPLLELAPAYDLPAPHRHRSQAKDARDGTVD